MLSNREISQRLTVGFAPVPVLLMCITLRALSGMSSLNGATELIVHDRYPKTAVLADLKDEPNNQARALRSALLMKEPAKVAAQLDQVMASGTAAEIEAIDEAQFARF